MKNILVAFDIDGTLRDNTVQQRIVANERIRTLLILLAGMRNTTIMVWSGGGADYARTVAAAMAIEQYVDVYGDKGFGGYDAHGQPLFHTDVKPDITFDDIEEFDLGVANLIVDERGFTRATYRRTDATGERRPICRTRRPHCKSVRPA